MPIPAPWRGLLLAAGLIIAGTAILHGVGFETLSRELRNSGLQEAWKPAITGLWVMFSLHLGVVAGFLMVAAARPNLASDSALLLCALLLAVDTALLAGYIGLFAGTLLVGIGTALVIIARVLRQQNPAP